MKKRFLVYCGVIVLLFLAFFIFGKLTGEITSPKDVPVDSEVLQDLEANSTSRVIIELKDPPAKDGFLVFKKEKSSAEIETEKKEIKEKVLGEVEEEKVRHIFNESVSLEVTKDDLNELKKNDNIKFIGKVPAYTIDLASSVPLIHADDFYQIQINGNAITGKGETVCVVDTGVDYTHPDLGGCFGANNASSDCKVIGGKDFCADDTFCNAEDDDPMDVHGHGTHVSGIVAANGTIKGVAPEAKIASVKVCSKSGVCYGDDIRAGVEWCKTNSDVLNISVISLSLGGGLYDDYCPGNFLASSINEAYDQNISVVIASGNGGSKTKISSPACVENAIAVASSTKTDGISTFSNRNAMVDLIAPGSSIISTCLGGGSCTASGTSMATPHVSGAFVLMNQFYREHFGRSATVAELEDYFKESGVTLSGPASGLNFSRIDFLAKYNAVSNASIDLSFLDQSYHNTSIINVGVNSDGYFSDWFYKLNDGKTSIFVLNSPINLSQENNTFALIATTYLRENKSANASLFLDILSPGISFTNKTDENGSLKNQSWVFVDVSIDEAHQNGTLFRLYQNKSLLFENFTNATSFNWSGLRNTGWYVYNATTIDLAGNSNATVSRNIFLNIPLPKVKILSPANNTFNSKSVSLKVNAGMNEALFSYELDGGKNVSFEPNTSLSDLSNGQHVLHVWRVNNDNTVSKDTILFAVNVVSSQGSSVSSSGGGSSSSSSNSGGGSPSTSNVIEEDTSSGPAIVKLSRGQSSIIKIGDEEHKITVESVNGDQVGVIIESDPLRVNLTLGEEKKLNLTSPEFYDLLVSLEELSGENVSLVISEINEPIGSKAENATSTEPIEESSPLKLNFALKAALIILAMLIVLVIVFRIFKKKKAFYQK